ncbi:MAG: hypothetical protein ACLQVL_36720 [Terriglobia bacterium]
MRKEMYTTQREVRNAFWQAAHDGQFAGMDVTRNKITDYSGKGKMHNTDTRCAFVDYVDGLEKSGEISAELANEVTL